MDVKKGGVLFLDLTTVDLTSESATNVPGVWDALTRTKGKPVHITCTFGSAIAAGFPTISYGDSSYNMTISAYSEGTLIVIELVVDDDDDVTPTVIVLTPAEE